MSRNRKNKKVKSTPQKIEPSIEIAPLPGFPWESFNSNRSSTELDVWKKDVQSWIVEQVQNLENLLLQYSSFDMIANLMLTELGFDPEKGIGIEDDGLAVIVEYVALLYLKHPYNVGAELIIDKTILDQVIGRTRSIISAVVFNYAVEGTEKDIDVEHEMLDELRFKTILNEIYVRSPGYAHHQQEKLSALFSDFDEWFLENLGFTIEDVFKVEQGIKTITESKFNKRLEDSRVEYKNLLALRKTYRAGKEIPQEYVDVVRELAELPSSQAKKVLKNRLSGWVFFYIGTTVYSFTNDELASKIGLSLEKVTSLLNFFSLEFDSINKDYFAITPTHELKRKPMLANGLNYLYPLPGAMIWTVQSRFEEILNPSSSDAINSDILIWENYANSRAGYLEKEALRLLKETLQISNAYNNLNYMDAVTGEQLELDGLLIFDTTLILLEAKSGVFTLPARRGGKERIKRDLKHLLGEAHAQALRAKEYIENNEEAKFIFDNKRELIIRSTQYRRIILVTVTLESLDLYNSMLHRIAKTGVFVSERELPWAVSLDTLRVISEINEFPTQLIHYILRRLRIHELGNVESSDELDYFIFYLQKGLYFDEMDEVKNDKNNVMIYSDNLPIDNYYFHQMGIRKASALKPVQKMPKLLHDVIIEIENRRDSGFSDAVIQLLDWGEDTRKKFVELFQRFRKQAARDRKIHDFSLASGVSRLGLTCFITTKENAENAFEKLGVYVQVKKYQTKCNSWLGLLSIVGASGLVHGFVTGIFPWSYDANLENGVKEFGLKMLDDG